MTRLVRVVVCGPTASGKSALAMALAAAFDATIVNADALQVYGCWRILTARPGVAECAQTPHALYGHVACDAPYSVGHWLREIEPLVRADRALVIVGGTGLYLSALTQGLNDIPATTPQTRAASEAYLARHGLEGLRAAVAKADPEAMARLDPQNARRLQRAWEVVTQTGKPLSEWQKMPVEPLLPLAQTVPLILQPDTEVLNARITARLHAMVAEGALQECVANAGLDPTLPAAKALGAAQFWAHLRGEMGLEDAVEAAATATHQFAKRQRTWIRSRFGAWQNVAGVTPEAVIAQVRSDR